MPYSRSRKKRNRGNKRRTEQKDETQTDNFLI